MLDAADAQDVGSASANFAALVRMRPWLSRTANPAAKQFSMRRKFGCFNLHASLLPLWRGAAPIDRAIMAGDTESGVTVMKMDVGLDTGDVALEERAENNR